MPVTTEFAADRVYAVDIETDTSGGFGLDPTRGGITEIDIAAAHSVLPGGGATLSGAEPAILAGLQEVLRELPPGLLATWNGIFFDWPFIATRAAMNGVYLGLRLTPNADLRPKYDYLPGHAIGYDVAWTGNSEGNDWGHAHLDVSLPYKTYAATAGVPWGLKPVARSLGIDMIELDRARMHEYTSAEIAAYVRSDTRGTRLLALRHLGLSTS